MITYVKCSMYYIIQIKNLETNSKFKANSKLKLTVNSDLIISHETSFK